MITIEGLIYNNNIETINKGTKTMTQTKTYQIQINESQRELISRALNNLSEVDIESHEDLAQDIEGEPKLILTEKGTNLEYL